jgi:1-acyl-sn-glycerol-3-phosphate acyltransferase
MSYLVTRRIIPFLCRPLLGKCVGIENIPIDKGAILAANHSSYFDHLVVGCNIVPRMNKMVYFLAKKQHFDTFLQRQWHRYFKAIPLDRESGGREALREAIEYLRKGDLIVIYPEGTRTLTGRMNRAKTGVVRLALAARVPILPMGITNTFYILPKGKRFPKFGKKADLFIGEPIYLDQHYGKDIDGRTLREITTTIMKEIARLSNQEYNFDAR